jgi:CheY-like chemotaxis protein/thioredoxin-like negative regulator of GroEL
MALPSNFFSTQSVLVIDDIDAIRSAVKGMLQMLGCRDIATAGNGNRALELCQKTKFDFILCDFNLGKGKDGYQLFEELKLKSILKSNTVFIMLSAETTLQVVHGLVELQPDDYLLKPFSYKKLESRLVRALDKRKILGAIYDAYVQKDYQKALAECTIASQKNSQYLLVIMRIKGEILLSLGQPQVAFELYCAVLKNRDLSWAKLGKAIAYYHLGNYEKSSKLLVELCNLRETRIEALNWLSSIYAQRQNYSEAQKILIESVKLSPKNIPRQRALANISLLENDLTMALRCFKGLLDNTRFSVHEHIDHHFNYIHSLIDSSKGCTQLQQAKIFSQIQPVIKSAAQSFDKKICSELEKVVSVRILIIKGKLKEAITLLHSCDQQLIFDCGRNSGLAYANTWFEFGDYEKYNEILTLIQLPSQSNNIDEMSEFLLFKKEYDEHKNKINQLIKLNEHALQLYRNGLYPAATRIFLDAHKIMPNNFQTSFCLAQSIVKGWPTTETFSAKKTMVEKCINVIESEIRIGEIKDKYDVFKHELKAI